MERNSQLSKVQSYFDRNSSAWRDLYVNSRTANEFVLQERLDYALDLLSKNVPLGATVLDAGCGSGLAAMKIALMGYSAHGVDISPQMIALCHERSSRNLPESVSILFSAGDFMEMEFEPSHYEAVIALGFLEYQTDELAVLRGFHRITKTGGLLIVSGPQRLSLSGAFGLTGLALKLTGRQALALHGYSRARMSRLLSSAGFEVKCMVRHGFALLPIVEALIGFRTAISIHQSLTALSKVLPINAFANDIVVAAIKKG